jgi:VWFA-related protein
MMIRILTATLLATLAAAPPQIPAQLGETIEVSVTNVDVVVTDAAGHRVHGLTKNDFAVYEDGKLQPLTNFAAYGDAATSDGDATSVSPDAAAPAEDTAAETGSPQRRTIVMYFDRFRSPEYKTKVVFDAMRDFLHQTIRPGDHALIAQWTGRLFIRQPLTGDVDKLDAVLDALERENTGVQIESAATETTMMWASQKEFEKDVYQSSGGKTYGIPNAEVASNLGPVLAAREEMMELRAKTDAIEALMSSAAGDDGRKILLMATRNFGFHAGAEFFGGTVPLRYEQELNTVKLRDRLTNMANANGFVIYPIFPEGIGTKVMPDSSYSGTDHVAVMHADAALDYGTTSNTIDETTLMNQSTALDVLATQTGGALATGPADIAKLLPEIADDFESYYSLGFRSQRSDGDRTRHIDVRPKNPAYSVRARRAVVEKSAAARVKDRVIANLFGDDQTSAMPITATIGKPVKRGDRWGLTLLVHVAVAALTTIPNGTTNAGSFSVFVATGATFGTTSDIVTKSQSFSIPDADLPKARASHFTFELELTTDGRAETVSVGVMDDATKEYGLARIALPPAVVAHNRR